MRAGSVINCCHEQLLVGLRDARPFRCAKHEQRHTAKRTFGTGKIVLSTGEERSPCFPPGQVGCLATEWTGTPTLCFYRADGRGFRDIPLSLEVGNLAFVRDTMPYFSQHAAMPGESFSSCLAGHTNAYIVFHGVPMTRAHVPPTQHPWTGRTTTQCAWGHITIAPR